MDRLTSDGAGEGPDSASCWAAVHSRAAADLGPSEQRVRGSR